MGAKIRILEIHEERPTLSKPLGEVTRRSRNGHAARDVLCTDAIDRTYTSGL